MSIVPTGVFTVDIPEATAYTIDMRILSIMIAKIDIAKTVPKPTLNAVL
jgi:hypothetical protein